MYIYILPRRNVYIFFHKYIFQSDISMILSRSERCANKVLKFWRLVTAVQSRHPIAHPFRHRTLTRFPWHEGNDAVNTSMVQTNRNTVITPTPNQSHPWRAHNKIQLYQCTIKGTMACPACIVVHSLVVSMRFWISNPLPSTQSIKAQPLAFRRPHPQNPRNSISSCGSAVPMEALKSPATSGVASSLTHADMSTVNKSYTCSTTSSCSQEVGK